MLNPPLIYSINAKLANVQTTFSFWRTTENLFILALLSSLYKQQTFYVHVGFEKRNDK